MPTPEKSPQCPSPCEVRRLADLIQGWVNEVETQRQREAEAKAEDERIHRAFPLLVTALTRLLVVYEFDANNTPKLYVRNSWFLSQKEVNQAREALESAKTKKDTP